MVLSITRDQCIFDHVFFLTHWARQN